MLSGKSSGRAAASGTEIVSATVRILHLEDDDVDADLVRVTLKRAGLDSAIARVTTRDEFLSALGDGAFDVILADFTMPDYDGHSALRASCESSPGTPFIFVSGAMGDEIAIKSLREGAADYVLKDRLVQLAPAIERALAEVENRRQRAAGEIALRESEELLTTTLAHAPVVLSAVDLAGVYRVSTGGGLRVLGLEPGELVGQSLFEHFKDVPAVVETVRRALDGESLTAMIVIGESTFEMSYSPVFDDRGGVSGAAGVSVEISERVQAEHEILALNSDLERTAFEARAAQQKTYIAYLKTIERMALAAEYKDEDTGAHIMRMRQYCVVIGRGFGLTTDEVDTLMHAAPMHDVGKIGIPDAILLKPGKLDADEWEVMKRHSEIGARLLSGSESEILQAGEVIALSHHEKWDGSGYPHGLAGEDIPLWGRIAAIADVFEALTSKRPYKDAFPVEKAVAIMREGRATHFDQRLLDLFLGDLDAVRAIHDR
jgi:PAS domain S-box-containing protein